MTFSEFLEVVRVDQFFDCFCLILLSDCSNSMHKLLGYVSD